MVLLSACSTPRVQIQYVPQKVEVPVPVKCTPPDVSRPEFSFDKAKKDDLLFNNLALLAAENDNLIVYSTKLKAALDACTK